MHPHPSMMLSGLSSASFIGVTAASSVVATSADITLPAATQAGDLVMIHAHRASGSGSVSGGAGGWTRLNFGSEALLWKIAAAGDLAVTLTVNLGVVGIVQAAAYRGCTSVAFKTETTVSGVVAGYAKSAVHKGLVSFVNTRVNADTLTVNGGLTLRGSNIANINAPATGNVADLLAPPYVGSTAITWTSGLAAANIFAQLLELT